jgi:GNAT superfamily N-acetyltransferase
MLQYKTLSKDHKASELLEMMRSLYEEDPAGPGNTPGKPHFERTIQFLSQHPDSGRIVLLELNNTLQGYAILIPYWSNEFGGTLLFVDELFVKPQARGQGIGRQFFEHLRQDRPYDAVACALEVSPKNDRARRLYTSLGFEPRSHAMLFRRFE